ncbi:hypothetical protein ACOMHN_052973 [Nucella lapillus]
MFGIQEGPDSFTTLRFKRDRHQKEDPSVKHSRRRRHYSSSSSSKRCPRWRVISPRRHSRMGRSPSSESGRCQQRSRDAPETPRTHGGSRFLYESESANSDGSDSSVERHHAGPRGNPRKLPKNLCYDGKTNWLSFKQKFESYKSVLCWSDQESRDYLGWCLEDKALDHFTMVTQMGTKCSYRQIMKKLEARFRTVELVETARIKFQQSSQHQDENCEDWADRVRTLAILAFRDLPEKFGQQEAVARFCQGNLDTEAGKHAYLQKPKTMEEALNHIKKHQYISQAMDSERKKFKEEVQIGAVTLSEDIANLKKTMAMLLKEIQALKNRDSKTPSVPQAAEPKEKCFFCRRAGHFKRDCSRYKKWLENHKMDNREEKENKSQTPQKGIQNAKIRRVASYPLPKKSPKGHPRQLKPPAVDNSMDMVSQKKKAAAKVKAKPDILQVNRVCASSSGVKINVGGLPIEAKVDSGAEITIISTSVFQQLKKKPKKIRDVEMHLADQGSSLSGFITEPLELKIGQAKFRENVHVAPIGDKMLLGYDLLHSWGAIHDMRTNMLLIGKEHVPLNMNVQNFKPVVARVMATRPVVIPPDTVGAAGKQDTTLQGSSVESADRVDILVPKPVRGAREHQDCSVESADSRDLWENKIVGQTNEHPEDCLEGLTEQHQSEKEGQLPANSCMVQEVKGLSPEEKSLGRICTSSGARKSGLKQAVEEHSVKSTRERVPAHLQQLKVNSGIHLTKGPKEQLIELLSDTKDVFTYDDLGQRNFTTIEHAIYYRALEEVNVSFPLAFVDGCLFTHTEFTWIPRLGATCACGPAKKEPDKDF